ncbi:MAG TPA: prepilin-type N-terminal cleavage/methylation domain-containing protein, partial [Phycisphaerales bacterium]|nr:prepilin-type N-terminal cleavage/methylation domain-containing protein [Phycisphaerales bacterium]
MNQHRKQYGFSLIELLLAIFILGIGIISIATLFPAGIAQQQKTTDDVIGPIVARNAMTLLRSKLDQQDFAGAEDFEPDWSPFLCEFSLTQASINPWPTICGDWMWRRPGIVDESYGEDQDINAQTVRGAIDIFATPGFEV